MNNSALPYWLALMVLLAATYGGWKWWQVEQFRSQQAGGGLEFDGPPLEQFELTERSGKPFRSRDMRGNVWVTTFFFATCPGTCPRLNANIKHLNSLEELEDVCTDVGAFVTELRKHEEAENELLMRSYYSDIGSGD